MSDSQLVKLTKQDFKANHSLGKVRAIERVDAIGAYHATLNLYLAHTSTVHWFAREESCLVYSLSGDIQEVIWKNLLSVLYHLN